MAWNKDENFSTLISMLCQSVPPAPDLGQHPGGILNRDYTAAPAGKNSWGLQGCTFLTAKDDRKNRTQRRNPIDCQSYEPNGNGLRLYAKEAQGRLGFVKCLQGWVWHGLVKWNVPCGLDIKTHRNLHVYLDLEHHSSVMYSGDNSWVMQAINVWLAHAPPRNAKNQEREEYRKKYGKLYRGGVTNPDGYGHKALVLDLMFWLKNEADTDFRRADEGRDAFHYQRMVQVVPPGTRKSLMIDLSYYINDALQSIPMSNNQFHPIAVIPNWELRQLEYVIEVSNAEGEATVRHLRLEG